MLIKEQVQKDMVDLATTRKIKINITRGTKAG